MATINGTGSNDTLNGTSSADNIYGYGGSDLITAGSGNDYISGSAGADTVYGGDGNDQIFGETDNDLLYGDLGNDVIYGDAGNDTLVGGLGDDHLYGGVGVDSFLVDGVTGWDSYTGGDSFYNNNQLTPHIDAIILQTINPYAVWGEIKISFLSGIERIANLQTAKPVDIIASGSLDLSAVSVEGIRQIKGSSGTNAITGTIINDVIDGQGGNDTLAGGTGNDTLLGDMGNDRILGGAGSDSLTGGSGVDTFVFGSNEGSDRIADFADGSELIDISLTSATSIADLTITSSVDGWAMITIDSTVITVVGVTAASIDSSDFIF
jgi:Ca2+-binding RTX toxin-like protein